MTVKIISLIRRKPGLSREAFIDYYESRHVLLGLRHTEMCAYRRNYVDDADPTLPGDPVTLGFDVITESVFADRTSLERSWAHCADPAVTREFEVDEAKFIDRSVTKMFVVGERDSVVVNGPKTNRAKVERLSLAMETGDWSGTETHFYPDAVIYEAVGLPFGGVYRGTSAAQARAAEMRLHLADCRMSCIRVIGEVHGEHFAVLSRLTGRMRSTNYAFATEILDHWELVDGKVRTVYAFQRMGHC